MNSKKFELVKREDRYDLYADDGSKIASTSPNPMGKLSLKNCQAIEDGYDINTITSEMRAEFISKYGDKSIPLAEGGHWSRGLDYQCGVIDGFQKALEILGDKKFTENNIDEAFDVGYEMLDSPKSYNDALKEFKKSLEPTEWNVEVEIEVINHGKGEDGLLQETIEPKLDAENCLILKLKL